LPGRVGVPLGEQPQQFDVPERPRVAARPCATRSPPSMNTFGVNRDRASADAEVIGGHPSDGVRDVVGQPHCGR
jgi:hypothetical protein